MITLRQIRLHLKPTYTHSELFILDSSLGRYLDFAHIIEDKVRDINGDGDLNDPGEGKVFGQTAIPYTGKDKFYLGQVRESPKRRRLFEQGKITEDRLMVPYIDNVPGFSAIQIHSGTDEADSLGCLIIGYKWNGQNKVWDSRTAERDLVKLILQNDKEGKFKIEII